MNRYYFRLYTIAVGVLGVAVGFYYLSVSWSLWKDMNAVDAATQRGPASVPLAPELIVLDELFANVRSGDRVSHGVSMKLELELFDDAGRALLETRLAGVKDTVLQAALEQDFARLETLPGKLYFKEAIATRINEYVNHVAVREVHFASFFLH